MFEQMWTFRGEGWKPLIAADNEILNIILKMITNILNLYCTIF